VLAAGISHQDRPPLYPMARPAVCRTTVNSVLVVEAAASRVELDQLVAHGEGFLMRLRLLLLFVVEVGSRRLLVVGVRDVTTGCASCDVCPGVVMCVDYGIRLVMCKMMSDW
jgi:hypothetical protein